MPNPRKRPTVVNAKKKKKEKRYVQIAREEYYRVRNVDLESLLFEGVIVAPMVNALVQFDKQREQLAKNDDLEEMLKFVTSKDFVGMLEAARRLAVAFVIEPRLTMSKKASLADEDLLWVGGYSDVEGEEGQIQASDDVPVMVLVQLFRALMKEAEIVVMNDDDALDFRTDESTSDVASGGDGGGVPSATVGSDAAVDDAVPVESNPAEPETVGASASAGN